MSASSVPFTAQAAQSRGAGPTDVATYEALTGDAADEDRAVWDSFYKTKSNAFGKEAVGFLKEHVHELRVGRAFVPAMGEGRNAIYLAKKGFVVDGNDFSEVAVSRAMIEASNQHVTIKAAVANLKEFQYPENFYDFIFVSLFYSPELVPKFKRALKKGGYIMFYNRSSAGKLAQKANMDDFLVKPSELKAELKDYQIKVFKEYKDHDIDVIGLLARKP